MVDVAEPMEELAGELVDVEENEADLRKGVLLAPFSRGCSEASGAGSSSVISRHPFGCLDLQKITRKKI